MTQQHVDSLNYQFEGRETVEIVKKFRDFYKLNCSGCEKFEFQNNFKHLHSNSIWSMDGFVNLMDMKCPDSMTLEEDNCSLNTTKLMQKSDWNELQRLTREASYDKTNCQCQSQPLQPLPVSSDIEFNDDSEEKQLFARFPSLPSIGSLTFTPNYIGCMTDRLPSAMDLLDFSDTQERDDLLLPPSGESEHSELSEDLPIKHVGFYPEFIDEQLKHERTESNSFPSGGYEFEDKMFQDDGYGSEEQKVGLRHCPKSMDVLESYINEPMNIAANVSAATMVKDLQDMQVHNHSPQTIATSDILHKEFEVAGLYRVPSLNPMLPKTIAELYTQTKVLKKRKRCAPRQEGNKRSRYELVADGFHETLNISGIPVFKHEDKGMLKRWLCFECGKSFRGKSEVVVHIRTHTGEKPLLCKYCFKKFAHPSNLKVHERSHRGEHPYKCNAVHCGKAFAHSISLKEHQRKHDLENNGLL